MASQKTEAEIQAEIKLLQEMKPRIRRRTILGKNNHAAIDAQIYALTVRMRFDQAGEKYGVASTFEDGGDYDQYVLDAALEACDWMRGGSTIQPPSEGWAELVGK